MITDPLPGVRVVEVVSGVGMTTALGLAPRVLSELLDGATTDRGRAAPPPALPAARRPTAAARADCGS
jgi:hypothetical protein